MSIIDYYRIYEQAEKLRNYSYSTFLELDNETKEIWFKIHELKEKGEDVTNIFIDKEKPSLINRIKSIFSESWGQVP